MRHRYPCEKPAPANSGPCAVCRHTAVFRSVLVEEGPATAVGGGRQGVLSVVRLAHEERRRCRGARTSTARVEVYKVWTVLGLQRSFGHFLLPVDFHSFSTDNAPYDLLRLHFSPAEAYFYRRQHEACRVTAERVLKNLPAGLLLNGINGGGLLRKLEMLRQACCHPQVGGSGLRSLSKQQNSEAMTMGEVVDALIRRAKVG